MQPYDPGPSPEVSTMPSRLSRRLPRRPSALIALAVSVVAVTTASQATASSGRTAVAHGPNGKRVASSFHATPKLFGLNHGAGEPTLGITRQGYVIVTAGSGCVTSCPGSTESLQTVAPGGRAVFGTKDKGKTWQDISPGAKGVSPHVTSQDPYMFVDHSGEVDRAFDIDLNLACNMLSYSDNFGATWITNPLSCGEPVNDHQTVFSGKPVTSTPRLYSKIVYYCFNKLKYTDCTKSLDGGLTFLPTANTTNPECSGLNGHGVSDSRGWIYIPYTGCGEHPAIAMSKDEGSSFTVLHPAPTSQVNGGDPSLAVDKKDNLYLMWNDSDRRPVLSTSTNGGMSWSKPISVAAPGVVRTNLATLTVGAPGKIAVAYYGTSDTEDKGSFWNGYIASGVGVLGPNPVFYSASINDPKHALKANGCGPGRCGRVLDFIDVEIAPDGSPWAVYVDACGKVCEETKVVSLHDNLGLVGNLVGGPNLAR